MAPVKPYIIPCFACGEEFQFGPDAYNGKYIPTYKISVCQNCYSANHDGWAPHYESKILEKLKAEELPVPKRNVAGWLPRD